MNRVAGSLRCLLLVAVVMHLAVTVRSAIPADLVPSLPGQASNVTFKQYAGYITVNETAGRKLFYYFVEAVNSSSTKPLVLWLNGGPGCSSLIGGFTELGPFYPNTAGDGLNVNENSWNQVANVIFLESPAGVGFSYSNDTSDYLTGDQKTAQDALTFLLGWLADYPEYSSNDFYITGESYAGHYVPQLAAAVVQNNKVPGQAQISLKGIMVGNPLFDSVIDLEYAPLEYGWGHGMVSEDVHDIILQECNYTSSTRNAPCIKAETLAATQMFNSGYIDAYDILADVCTSQGAQALRLKATAAGEDAPVPDPCILSEVDTYLNRPDVQTALHAEVSSWKKCSGIIHYNYSDVNIPIAPLLADLVSSKLRLWVYTGDLDTVVCIIGTRKILNDLARAEKWQIISGYQAWFQGSQVGGFSISWADSVVYSTVRGAGHTVPTSQPARSLVLFSSFLAGDIGPPSQPTQ